MSTEGVTEAARSVRPYLAELVGPAAAEIDGRLATLLAAAAAGADVEADLQELLESHEGTAVYLEAVLDDPPGFRPPQVQISPARADYSGLPGESLPVAADRYVCPVLADYVWYRPSVGVPVPACPTHRVLLTAG